MTNHRVSRPMPHTDDDTIVEHLIVLRAQLGDPDAFGLLLDRHHERVFEHVRRLVRSSADAEDVLQDVWITVVRKIATLEDPRAFRAWLYRIARNRALSRLRWKQRRRDVEGLDSAVAISTMAESPDESRDVLAEFDPDAVRSAMLRLSYAHREVLTLRYFEDFTYGEIARIIGHNPGTVRSRIHYAKKALERDLRSRIAGPVKYETQPTRENGFDEQRDRAP